MTVQPSNRPSPLRHSSTADATTTLVPVTDGVWVTQRRLRFLGIEVGTRMTVVRLSDGTLWLHSPVAPDDELCAQIESLGRVAHIVAPNRMHHLYAGDVHERFPDAALHLAPGLLAKRPDLGAGVELDAERESPWGEQIAWHRVGGLRVLGEVVFYAVATRTLIVTDLAFNFGPDAPWGTRQFGRLAGTYGKLGCPADVRLLFRADRKEFAASIESIAGWDFERIIVAHGEVVTADARVAFDRAFSFVRRG